jgi:hypothetical protein
MFQQEETPRRFTHMGHLVERANRMGIRTQREGINNGIKAVIGKGKTVPYL